MKRIRKRRKIKLKDVRKNNGVREGKQASYMPGFEGSLMGNYLINFVSNLGHKK